MDSHESCVSRGTATLSVSSAQGRYQPRTTPRLLTAEHEVALTPSGVATTLCTAYVADTDPKIRVFSNPALAGGSLFGDR